MPLRRSTTLLLLASKRARRSWRKLLPLAACVSFDVEYLTDLVEEAVYKEFEAISERGGELGGMETTYQRSKIQEVDLY